MVKKQEKMWTRDTMCLANRKIMVNHAKLLVEHVESHLGIPELRERMERLLDTMSKTGSVVQSYFRSEDREGYDAAIKADQEATAAYDETWAKYEAARQSPLMVAAGVTLRTAEKRVKQLEEV